MTKTISINPRGTVTLPKPMRRRLGLPDEGGLLLAQETPEGILLRAGKVLPVEIYDTERLAEFQRSDQELAAFAARLKKAAPKRRKR